MKRTVFTVLMAIFVSAISAQTISLSFPHLISADKDKNIFENTTQQFPWSNKYCDFAGFEGDNFKNYGVIGSPTIYLIDENKIIEGRYARLEDALASYKLRVDCFVPRNE